MGSDCPGELNEHVQEKTTPFEYVCSQIVPEIIFDKGRDAGQGVGPVPDAPENLFPPMDTAPS